MSAPPMFQATRLRLAFWYSLVTALLLLIFAAGVYDYVRSTLVDRIDDTISHVAEVIERAPMGKSRSRQDQMQMFFANVPSIEADHIDIEWFDSQGNLLWTTFSADLILPLTPPNADVPVIYRTVRPKEMEPLRQLTAAIGNRDPQGRLRGEILGYLRVSHPWFEVTKPSEEFITDLVIGIAVMVTVVALCGWWLSGLAMRPVYDSYQRLKQFTADASHELRNPVAVIQTNVQAALADPNWQFQQEQLAVIERLTRRLGRLLDDLLFLARHDDNSHGNTQAPCDLAEILQQVYEEQALTASSKQVNLTFLNHCPNPRPNQYSDDPALSRAEVSNSGLLENSLKENAINSPATVIGDSDQLVRLFTNLVSNAINYNRPDGQVTIELQPLTTDKLQVQINDTGIGIPETALPYIFERFYRYQPRQTVIKTATKGSGLGLAIAKAITDSHQGMITVNSHADQGTSFTVTLPMAKSSLKIY
ncbi:MAG: sensor histidine kinase [Pseudanabaenaceae cyanobacterium]|jgi:two-component system, OmpR family, manganese sensing sensor histidine kinase